MKKAILISCILALCLFCISVPCTAETAAEPTPEPARPKSITESFQILYYDDSGEQQALPFALRNSRQNATVADGPLVFNLYLRKYLDEQYKPPVITVTDPEKPLVTAWHDPESLAHFRADIRISSWDRTVPGDAEIKDLEPGEYYLTVSIYASRDSNNFVTGACYLYFIIPEKD